MSIRTLSALREVAGDYDGFILDLWGLIHDGINAYPQSAETLRHLKEAGKKTLLLSNAPRRAHALIEGMENMGIGRALYGDVLSSGEATRDALITRKDPFFAALGRRAYHLGPERDRSAFEDTGLEIVAKVADSDFIANTGPVDTEDAVETYTDVLTAGIAKNLPMVCANPDMLVIRGGKPVICAGAIAKRYKELGGRVGYRGKPDPAIYDLAVERLGVRDRKRVAVMGDALETDVKGGNAAGLASIWCTGGIHAKELGVSYGVAADPEKAAVLARQQGQIPTATIPGFIW